MSRMLRKIAGGIATGAGNYLVNKATEDSKARMAEALFNREMALKKYENDRDDARVGMQTEAQKQIIAAQGQETRTTNRQTADYQEAADNRRGTIETNRAVLLENLRNKHEIARLKLSKNAELELARFNATADGRKVQSYDVNAEGFIIGLTANGEVVNTGQKAGFKPKAPDSDSEGSGIDAFRPGGGTGVKGSGGVAPTSGGSVAVGTVIDGPNGPMKMGPDGKWQKL